MQEQLKILQDLLRRMTKLDADAAEGFGEQLHQIAIEARHSLNHGEVDVRTLVVNSIQRSLRWWHEVGHDRHYSQRCTDQVEQCLQAANRAAGANNALMEAFDALVHLLSGMADRPDNERSFLASRIESMGHDIRHSHGHNDNDSIDLLALWNQFHSDSYPEFVFHLLSWCYENDDYHDVSEVCGWLFGSLPVTDQIQQVLEKGIQDTSKSERLRERFKWIYSRQFKD